MKNCPYCSATLNDDSRFCSKCGQPYPYQNPAGGLNNPSVENPAFMPDGYTMNRMDQHYMVLSKKTIDTMLKIAALILSVFFLFTPFIKLFYVGDRYDKISFSLWTFVKAIFKMNKSLMYSWDYPVSEWSSAYIISNVVWGLSFIFFLEGIVWLVLAIMKINDNHSFWKCVANVSKSILISITLIAATFIAMNNIISSCVAEYSRSITSSSDIIHYRVNAIFYVIIVLAVCVFILSIIKRKEDETIGAYYEFACLIFGFLVFLFMFLSVFVPPREDLLPDTFWPAAAVVMESEYDDYSWYQYEQDVEDYLERSREAARRVEEHNAAISAVVGEIEANSY